MKVLAVIDMQNDFIDGALGTPEAQAIVPKVCDKIKNFDGDFIAVTRDTHLSDYLETNEGKHLPVKHCIQYTSGWGINPEVSDVLDSIEWNSTTDMRYIDKPTFGTFKWKRILSDYTNITEITLIGLCTDICVVSNALILKALYPEARIVVDSSCCAGVTPAKHEAALEVMRSCQIEVE